MELCACASRRESVRVKAGLPSAACPTITAQKELQCIVDSFKRNFRCCPETSKPQLDPTKQILLYLHFLGVKCNTICEASHYGSDCSSSCYCEHGSCDPHDGGCVCSRGFSGPKCDIPCSPGFYGVNCRQACPPCNSSKCYIILIIVITITTCHVT